MKVNFYSQSAKRIFILLIKRITFHFLVLKSPSDPKLIKRDNEILPTHYEKNVYKKDKLIASGKTPTSIDFRIIFKKDIFCLSVSFLPAKQ